MHTNTDTDTQEDTDTDTDTSIARCTGAYARTDVVGWSQRGTREIQKFTKENEDFQEKILNRSGLGQRTFFPVCTWSPSPSNRWGSRDR
jgi:hypothetical protein